MLDSEFNNCTKPDNKLVPNNHLHQRSRDHKRLVITLTSNTIEESWPKPIYASDFENKLLVIRN